MRVGGWMHGTRERGRSMPGRVRCRVAEGYKWFVRFAPAMQSQIVQRQPVATLRTARQPTPSPDLRGQRADGRPVARALSVAAPGGGRERHSSKLVGSEAKRVRSRRVSAEGCWMSISLMHTHAHQTCCNQCSGSSCHFAADGSHIQILQAGAAAMDLCPSQARWPSEVLGGSGDANASASVVPNSNPLETSFSHVIQSDNFFSIDVSECWRRVSVSLSEFPLVFLNFESIC